MFSRPQLRSSLRLAVPNAKDVDVVFLLSEREEIELDGHLFKLVLPFIDGHHTVDEIVEQLSEKVSPPEVYYALLLLRQKGCIVESDGDTSSSSTVFCDTLNLASTTVQNRLQLAKVAVKNFSSIATAELTSTLESMQVQVSGKGDLDVVLTNDYLDNELDAINQQALHHSHPWMLVKPLGTIIWLGPIFYPGKTGCWECLRQRLQENRPIDGFLQRHEKGIATSLTPPLACLPSTRQLAIGMAATEIFKWIVQGENRQLEGTLVTYDILSLKSQSHMLVKRPQCPVCGDPKLLQNPLPLILGSRKKPHVSGNGSRCCSPEETIRKYQYQIGPSTGMVRDLKKVFSSQLNGLLHIYVAKHHFISMFDGLNDLHQNLIGRSCGKGKTDEQARVSALGEAIERYSGVFQDNEPRQKASYQSLGERAIHPNACMLFSSEQYDKRDEYNAKCPTPIRRIPDPFDEEREIEWTPVWSLTHQEFKYLPTAYCYHGYPELPKADCWADTNGCAAGNTLEEAFLHGFMELVERECVALWWHNRIQRPEVDLHSFEEPYFQSLKAHYRTLNRDLWVLDITSDFQIPTFAAISRRCDREVEDIIFGFGTDFNPKIAIERAITEATTILTSVCIANADGSTRYPQYADPFALEWWKTATLRNQSYLIPNRDMAPKVYNDYPQQGSDDLREDLRRCQQLVEEKGLEMLVLDQTRPDIGLRVAKVIIPGIRHIWRRFGSGRLYEVPVQLGWLKEPLKEDQLNPYLMWI